MNAKKAIIKAMIQNEIYELMVKTQADNVFLPDGTTVAAKLAEAVATLNEKATKTEMTTAISTAISELIGGAPATYDTLKEIADYIETHEEVVSALNAAIGDKADKTALEAVKATVDALGALAKKNTVAEGDLDTSLKAKVNAAADGNHSHANKATLDSITADNVVDWNAKAKIYTQPTQPANLTDKDLWLQTIE